jgi:uncharacterized protein YbbC (DUF1343 family)
MKMLAGYFIGALLLLGCFSCAQTHSISKASTIIEVGAEQTQQYLPLLKGKRVAVFANQTSIIRQTHLVDSLLKLGIQIVKIFGPEHGFRGTAGAGEAVSDGKDSKTGIPIISLYGNHKKPTPEELSEVDVMLFDIQDIGVRFYTYISSLQYYLEAAIENDKDFVLLDRPNPNGFYIDGPVLDMRFKSFVGMQPIPVVYGMTIGEYAQMLVGERWLSSEANQKIQFAHIHIIPCSGYTHDATYRLPVAPSPNLQQMQSLYLYPSTCFFEGTILSEGRGTDKPFQVFGHPMLPDSLYSFTPAPNAGASNSKCYFQKCYGWNLSGSTEEILSKLNKQIQLKYLLDAYRLFPVKDSFFLANQFFNKLAGNDVLMSQIKNGMTEEQIKASWQPALNAFKAIRKKYLLYQDFKK